MLLPRILTFAQLTRNSLQLLTVSKCSHSIFRARIRSARTLAISQLRMLLVNGTSADAERLWTELITQARNVRLGSGTLQISDVWRSLRRDFALKDNPDYKSSWESLRAITQDYLTTIETELPTGESLQREHEADELSKNVASGSICLVFGESGTGKSALVKTTLNERFPKTAQVWLDPEHLALALNEATRSSLGINQPLIDVLKMSTQAENVLILDSAERFNNACVIKTKALIRDLTCQNAPHETPVWRILIVSQTEAWVGGKLQQMVATMSLSSVPVEQLSRTVVTDVLRSLPNLVWLAADSDAVSALRNLRTLAWVIQAATRFSTHDIQTPLYVTAIADHLWRYWTDDKINVQRLLIRLAERQANFEHSFAISEMESGDASVLDHLPAACPLQKDETTGRISFRHDLAADWARYQRLKEILDDPSHWGSLAANPIWHGALRMLGQFLLRQQIESRDAWDVVFDSAEQARETVPLADDILLDALFLDPNADEFLDHRAEMLLASGGARLLRLVNRFEHVASVPSVNTEKKRQFGEFNLYIKASFRTPVYARWPAIARFLAKYRPRVAKMTSPAIARLCDRWLSSTPAQLQNGHATPFRREFAELAIASARELQLQHLKGATYLGEAIERIYQSALASAPDLPSEVSEWSLEMAGRRALRSDTAEQLRVHRNDRALEHSRRLETDSKYRARHERLASLPASIPFRKQLPPWPLGPRHRLDRPFREAILRSAGFHALIRSDASVAGEVLLACIIEDQPEEKYRSTPDIDNELGIETDSEAYPTAPWKSPFYAFLQINPETALYYLNQLVNFSTDRWVDAVRKTNNSEPAKLSVRFADGTVREYAGNYHVFAWSHHNSLFIGQLHCALAALEQWLCDQIDAGNDVSPHVQTLFRGTSSVAVLGVLVNIGKYSGALFEGPLLPLLGVQEFYFWDYRRAMDNPHNFDSLAWVRSGSSCF